MDRTPAQHKGSATVSNADIKLNAKDIYLLGVLAECTDRRLIGTARLPRGCNQGQAEALARAGYLLETAQHFADGQRAVIYGITQKGLKAWSSYRFVP
jgi:hypothetical protein